VAFRIVSPTQTPREGRSAIDLADVMTRLDGNLPLLGRLLPQFIAASETRAAALRAALAAGNAAEAAALLHQMRGSAASVGAAAMTALAGEAEAELQHSGLTALADYPDEFDRALADVRQAADGIAAQLVPPEPGGEDGGGQIPALLDFLKTNNLRALDAIKECETFLVQQMGRETADEVLTAVEGLDFARAHEKLAGFLPAGAAR